MRRIESWLVFGLICFLWVGGAQAARPKSAGPKNIILMIGDGFGFEQAEAGRRLIRFEDPERPFVLDNLDPNPGSVDVSNVFGEITDSAAGGTALSTGCKTANGNVSMAADDVTKLRTNMEAAQAAGKAVGILSSVYMCDATPGVWVAHAPSRSCSIIIPQQINACPDVFLGAGETVAYRRGGEGEQAFDFIADFVKKCGHQVVENAEELAAAQAPKNRLLGIWGGYTLMYTIDQQNDPSYNLPTLAAMTAKAIDVLSRDPDGFFLMVEGGAIDWMAHNKDIAGTARDVVAFDEAIAVAYDFAKRDGKTALIVTADHETGGLDLGPGPEVPTGSGNYVPDMNVPFIAGITASTDFMYGLVLRGEMSAEDVLRTYAGVPPPVGAAAPSLTQQEKDAIDAYGEMAISDALNAPARANVQWILPNGEVSVAPDEGDHSNYRIPVWAYGPGTTPLEGPIDNTAIGKLLFKLVGVSAPKCPVSGR